MSTTDTAGLLGGGIAGDRSGGRAASSDAGMPEPDVLILPRRSSGS